MARAIWSGVLTFGLVSVPVRLFTATDEHTVRFHQLQRGTSDRVRYRRVNERTGEEVPGDQIVKGYDVGGEFVVVEPRELDEIAPGRSQVIDITGFVGLDRIAPVYFDRTYYLGPQGPEYQKVYELLREALAASGRAGIATFVMRNRQYLAAVRGEDDVLVLHTLHWADEVRDPHQELPDLPEHHELRGREVEAAIQLVEALAADWHPEEFHDTYRERVEELIRAKREGEEVVGAPEPPQATDVVDLMQALQSSIDQARGRRPAGGEKAGAAKKAGKSGTPAKATKPTKPERAQKAGRKAAGRRGGQAPAAADLEGLSRDELYRRAGELEIPGRSRMNREQLIEAIAGSGRARRGAARAG